MSNEEILARIGQDVTDIYGATFGKRDITIWITKRLFDRLFPEQFIIQKSTAMMTLFGCNINIIFLPYAGEQWIVGYEGTINENKSD